MNVLHDGFNIKYVDKTQSPENTDMILYDSTVIASPVTKNKDSVAIHWYDQSWTNKGTLGQLKSTIKISCPRLYHFLYNLMNNQYSLCLKKKRK